MGSGDWQIEFGGWQIGSDESTSPQPSPQRGEGEVLYSSTGTTRLSMM